MGDGLVEQINQSILNLLRGLVDREGDWKEHLQILSYLYRTTKHATTGLSPYEVLFGLNQPPLNIPTADTLLHRDPTMYSSQLPLNVRIQRNNKIHIVHVNRLRPLLRPDLGNEHCESGEQWSPPLFEYHCNDHPEPAPQWESPAAPQSGLPVTTRSGRVVKPVEYFGY